MFTADLDDLQSVLNKKDELTRSVKPQTTSSRSTARVKSYLPGNGLPRRWYITRHPEGGIGEEYLHIDGKWRNKAIVFSPTGEIESGLFSTEKRAQEILAKFTPEPAVPNQRK